MTCFIDPNSDLGFDALQPYIMPFAMGIPAQIVDHNARQSAIEFCRRSGILHDEIYIDLQKGVDEYFIQTVCDFEIVRVFEVSMLDRWTVRPTINKPRKFGFQSSQGCDWSCGPYGFYMQNVDVIRLSRSTQQDFPKGLRVEIVIQPKQDGCILDNYLYEYWADAIAAGALSRLLLLKTAPCYNPQLAKEYALKFRTELGRARGVVDMNFTSGPTMMRSERWV